MKKQIGYTFVVIAALFAASCNQTQQQDRVGELPQKTIQQHPDFDKDSAYTFVEQQVAFGPRVPNTKSHTDCGVFLARVLGRFADTVIRQPLSLKAYDGTLLHGENIIGVFNPEAHKRVLLAAHWDSRPYADQDPDPAHHRTPIDGANDGGSGVGVLLEIARQLRLKTPTIGVDIIFFDIEDYGEPQDEQHSYTGEYWCLGAQAWAKNPHVKNYKAQYGILLDMVGGVRAQFTKEGVSRQYALDILEKVWNRANSLGFSDSFQDRETHPILDDHLYINRERNIPTIDIIEWNPYNETGFNTNWHTIDDKINAIDRETLSIVGKVVLSVVYTEK
jgi:hypothetical protein